MPLIIHDGWAAFDVDHLKDELSDSLILAAMGQWKCRYCRHYNQRDLTICDTCGAVR
jgi:hypothetical protein